MLRQRPLYPISENGVGTCVCLHLNTHRIPNKCQYKINMVRLVGVLSSGHVGLFALALWLSSICKWISCIIYTGKWHTHYRLTDKNFIWMRNTIRRSTAMAVTSAVGISPCPTRPSSFYRPRSPSLNWLPSIRCQPHRSSEMERINQTSNQLCMSDIISSFQWISTSKMLSPFTVIKWMAAGPLSKKRKWIDILRGWMGLVRGTPDANAPTRNPLCMNSQQIKLSRISDGDAWPRLSRRSTTSCFASYFALC